MSGLAALRQAYGAAVDELNDPDVIKDGGKFSAVEARALDLHSQIERAKKAQSRAASLAQPTGSEGGD